MRHGKVPKFALARGLWLGEIPEELQQLSFAEKLLIGRVADSSGPLWQLQFQIEAI